MERSRDISKNRFHFWVHHKLFYTSPGNMKFGGVLLFTRLENFRRAMACDPEKCFLSMSRALNSLLNGIFTHFELIITLHQTGQQEKWIAQLLDLSGLPLCTLGSSTDQRG